MSEPNHLRSVHYRRGTVMGLTAAEAFMLICFILLLLLGLWRQISDEKTTEEKEFYQAFTESQREAAVLYKDELHELGEAIEKLEALKPSLIAAGTPEEVLKSVELRERLRSFSDEEIEDRVRLLDERLVEELAKTAATLPSDTLRKLTDLVALENVEERLSELSEPAATGEILAVLSQYQALRKTPYELEQMLEELGGFRSINVPVEDLQELVDKFNDLETARKLLAATGVEVAQAIRERAGSLITNLGGQINNDGSVIFPDRILFDKGKDEIKPVFDEVLQQFCRPWIEILYDVDQSLRSVQIEGHASSDWKSLPPNQAFEKNLDLSQDRAGAVFKRCLVYAGDDEIANWARRKMASIGYSSSYPVLVDGVEDREQSRRVVFAIDTRTDEEVVTRILEGDGASGNQSSSYADSSSAEDMAQSERGQGKETSDEIDEEIAALPTSTDYSSHQYTRLVGTVSKVRDGDTIVVASVPIRLEGMHAPELSDPFGALARTEMLGIVDGNELECWLSGASTHDREVGVCLLRGEEDIAAKMVAKGLARDCPAFSNGRYEKIEKLANTLPIGLPSYCN